MHPTPAQPSGQLTVPKPSKATTPSNPTTSPIKRQVSSDSCTPKNLEISVTVSGTQAMRMPVVEESIQRSPTPIAEKGTTNSTIANAKIAPEWPRIERSAPRCQAMGSMMAAARVTRAQAITNGESSCTATLMK